MREERGVVGQRRGAMYANVQYVRSKAALKGRPETKRQHCWHMDRRHTTHMGLIGAIQRYSAIWRDTARYGAILRDPRKIPSRLGVVRGGM